MSDAAHPDWIVETSDATFEQDVIERSREKPVVLDFWATWCQPCLMLKPVLEQLANEYAGRFVLVKAEQQSNWKTLEQFRVEGYPTVFAIVGGQPVDYFVGLMRPQQLRQWIDRLLEYAEFSQVEQLEESDPAAAEAEYRKALAKQPDQERLQIGLARVLLNQDKRDEAREIIARLESRGYLEPEAEKVKAALDLSGADAGNVAELRKQVAATPNDESLKLQFAQALAASSKYEEALSTALAIVEDGGHTRDDARKLMVEIFQVLPDDAPLKSTYQRKLSAALY
jgi:putative thioredoxin